MLNVSKDTIVDELESAKKLLEKWAEIFKQGLPVLDVPGDEEQLEMMIREFCGEMKVAAGKCANLADVVLGD